jgi:hypothetical protein
MLRITKLFALVGLALLISAVPVFAGTIGYTTFASFNAAAPGATNETFEGAALGTVAPGNGVTAGMAGALSFTANVAGGNFTVTNVFDAISGTHYLGSDFADGTLGPKDNFTVTLSSSSTAIGLYLLSAGPLAVGDFTLSVTGGNAKNSAVIESTLGDGTFVYFLGLTSSTAFTSATLDVTIPADSPFWNVDDIHYGTAGTTPTPTVPEPASLLLIGTGLVGVVRRFRKA